MENGDSLLTSKEAATLLGVSPSRVRQFVLENRLPAKKLGRDLVFLKSHVEAFSEVERVRTGRKKS